ncbi:unnamed protein product [Adineta steineri]|uniref:Peptidase S9 prolyl oligopeptidase catalytic domain-containing protein n=1 Tax=Adineta steineri TaxID=433720 RepID=A0A814VX94_9BILA|nr:unnamed protein product [Adineta steineri]CAF1191179.1 unnamed protein product [Adineta steineri]
MIRLYFYISLQLILCSTVDIKPKLTLDEFLDYTYFPSISLSPTNKHLLIQTNRPSWNTSSFENALWLHDIENRTKTLITHTLNPTIKPKWSPNGDWITLSLSIQQSEQYIYLYSIVASKLFPINIGNNIPLTLTWSNNNSVFYLATMNSYLVNNEPNDLDNDEWYDVIQYRKNQMNESTTIYQIDLIDNNSSPSVKINFIKNVSFLIIELLFVPLEEKIVYSTMSTDFDNMDAFELYSIDLRNISAPAVRLTNNQIFEHNLQLSTDSQQVFFLSGPLGSTKKTSNNTQYRLYSVNLVNTQMERLADNFRGSITGYIIKRNDNVYIIGQVGTQAHIYTYKLSTKQLIIHNGWNGTYQSFVSSYNNHSTAFVYSSFQKPIEVYFINNIDQLQSAEAITNFNQLFTQRDLPQAEVYTWKNVDDDQLIEGILHYPPGQYQSKNLPLFVLIHGGPSESSLNSFSANSFYWATIAASEGWLVLEPNYRGSLGYGDHFVAEVRNKPLSRPGKDILSGVDQLIKDGIADRHRLTVGGYSYGGLLTNWLITQTKRFNAAVVGAGIVEHASGWGTLGTPGFHKYFFGGFPWETPYIYQSESPFYQLDKVRTPTHIVAGERDMQVPTSQSYMLERALYYRQIPAKLIIFPNEGHIMDFNPIHGKVKIREELKWLKKYGNQSFNYNELSNNNEKLTLSFVFEIYVLFLLYLV